MVKTVAEAAIIIFKKSLNNLLLAEILYRPETAKTKMPKTETAKRRKKYLSNGRFSEKRTGLNLIAQELTRKK